MIKSNLGKKGFISVYNPRVTLHHWGRSEQKFKRTEEETTETCCSLACSPWLAQLASLNHPRPPAEGWYCPQWTGPSHINY